MMEAESAMLSSAWLSEDAEMISRLDSRDFVDPFHRWLLATLKTIVAAGEPLDAVAVTRRIRCDPSAPEDAHACAMQVLRSQPTTAHKDYYFRVLRIERGRRYLHRICDEAKQRDFRLPNEPMATFEWLQGHIADAIEKLKEAVK